MDYIPTLYDEKAIAIQSQLVMKIMYLKGKYCIKF